MHAQWIVRRFIDTHLSLMHAARRQMLCAAVAAAMAGHALSLSRLARAVTGSGRLKAALKRIDRLIGCARIEQEVELAAQGLLAQLSRGGQALVIAVDWSAVAPAGEFVELRAAVTQPGMGRALSVYQRVYPLAKMGSARAERVLLRSLARLDRAWHRSEHRDRCGLSAAVVCLHRGIGLELDRAGARQRVHRPGRYAADQGGALECASHRPGHALARVHLDCALRLAVRSGAGAPSQGGPQTLRSTRPRSDPQSARRGTRQCAGAVAAGALAATAHLSRGPDRGTLRSTHADRGELPRQQVAEPGHGIGVEPLALGAAPECVAAHPYPGGVPVVAYRSTGRNSKECIVASRQPLAPRANSRSSPWPACCAQCRTSPSPNMPSMLCTNASDCTHEKPGKHQPLSPTVSRQGRGSLKAETQ